MKKKKRLRLVLLSILALVLIYAVVCAGSIWRYAGVDETRSADAAIVLGAAAWESGPSPVYRERLNHGIWLWEQGYVKKLILTGGVAESNSRSDAAIGAEYALSQGVPAEAILLEETSAITEENLRGAAALMEGKGLETALLVSDPLHMRRAMVQAKDLGLRAYSSPTPTTLYTGFWQKLKFLARETFFYMGYRLLRPFRS